MNFETKDKRDEFILERRAENMPMRSIAKQVGLSHESVRRIILKAFEQARKVEIVRLIQAEGEHLADESIAALREMALDRSISPRTRIEAFDRMRLWHESKRKLFGADEPVRRQVEFVDTSGWEHQMRREIAAMERENELRAAEANRP